MKEALDILFSTHPHLKGQPEDKLMAFIFKYISQKCIEQITVKFFIIV